MGTQRSTAHGAVAHAARMATHTISKLAEMVGGQLRGEGSAQIHGVADVREAGKDQAAWVSRESFAEAAQSSRAGVILVPKGFPATPMPAILCEKIEPSIAALLAAFARPLSRPDPGVHASATIHASSKIGEHPSLGPHVVIDAEAKIGARCILHAGVFIGRGAILGDDCEIWPNTVIRDGCTLGSRVIIHSCTVIGGDGFGFYFDGMQHVKIPHIGGVIIEDDVEIGSCTCVDRSKFGNTVIGRGTKIDNHVQVAHNCRLGQHNILAGFTGLSGSVRTGDYCVMGARVTFYDNLNIGNHVQLGGMSVVTKDLPGGMKASGFPAQDMKEDFRERAAVRRLQAHCDKVKELVERVERLETSAHDNA